MQADYLTKPTIELLLKEIATCESERHHSFVCFGGASLVLQDLRKTTNDIDCAIWPRIKADGAYIDPRDVTKRFVMNADTVCSNIGLTGKADQNSCFKKWPWMDPCGVAILEKLVSHKWHIPNPGHFGLYLPLSRPNFLIYTLKPEPQLALKLRTRNPRNIDFTDVRNLCRQTGIATATQLKSLYDRYKPLLPHDPTNPVECYPDLISYWAQSAFAAGDEISHSPSRPVQVSQRAEPRLSWRQIWS